MIKGLPRISKKGFDLRDGFGQVLLLHGYTGTPYDVRMVGDFLHRHGFRVVAPRLLGHGTKPSDLYQVKAEDWIKQVQDVFDDFDPHRPIIVGGLSMGALLSILLAADNSNIRALLMFSPALSLGWLADAIIMAARFGLLSAKSSITKLSGGSDIMDPKAKAKSPCYKEMPVAGLVQFDKLRALALERLPQVTCPLFMAFAKNDGAIDALGSHRVAVAKTSQPIFSKFYPHSKHVLTLDYDRDELLKDLWHFLQGLR
ncbi:MAG TPA: alpha/beta fold hydrolase [Myxococcota bacterium]|nr:alpha/beta fold hydrolase [Myxococcota bacterium]